MYCCYVRKNFSISVSFTIQFDLVQKICSSGKLFCLQEMLNVTHQLKKKLFLSDSEENTRKNARRSTRSRVGSSDGMQTRDGSNTPQEGRRKCLPPLPSPDEEKSMNLSVAKQRTPSSPGSPTVAAYGPYFLEYTLMAEYSQLTRQRLPGVYVLPAAKSALSWYGVVFIRQGAYQDGIFKFTINIPENFPDGDCPSVTFKPAIYHPVVFMETGELDTKRAFPKWRRNVNHLWQVLLYIRRIFYKIDLKHPCNPEAAQLYEQDRDAFKQKVNACLRQCHNELHLPVADDPHAIRFVELSPQKHDELKSQIIDAQMKPESIPTANAHKSGLSWMKKGPPQIFSQEHR